MFKSDERKVRYMRQLPHPPLIPLFPYLLICLFFLPTGCASARALPECSESARSFLVKYLEIASEPRTGGLYFTERSKWKRAAFTERAAFAAIVKADPSGAEAAFNAALEAAEIEWLNMEFFMRGASRNETEAEKWQRAAIADFRVAHDLATALEDALGDAAAPFKQRLRALAARFE